MYVNRNFRARLEYGNEHFVTYSYVGAQCSVVVKALCYKAEVGGSRFDEVNEFS
jgi:hypothetical protein